MTTTRALLDATLAGKASEARNIFNTLVREKIDAKIQDLRPDVNSSVFGGKSLREDVPPTPQMSDDDDESENEDTDATDIDQGDGELED